MSAPSTGARLVGAEISVTRAPAWIAAWALFMVLKDPLFFPRILRYGKELQFISPLVALCLAAAVCGLPRPALRRAAVILVLATAAWLQARDFAHHAVTLRL